MKDVLKFEFFSSVDVTFVVKDEFGGNREEEGFVYSLELERTSTGCSLLRVRISFVWYVRERMQLEDVFSFLKMLGIEWDELREESLSICDEHIIEFYNKGRLVATLRKPQD